MVFFLPMTHKELKYTILQKCNTWINQRHVSVLKSIQNIETSLKEEAKSTSGDKHHTGRAMLQIDREHAGNSLKEIEKVQQQLKRIDLDNTSKQAHLGSLVYCNNATYFLSVSSGMVTVNNKDFICIAPNSPIGLKILGKKKNDTIFFHQKEIQILDIK